MPDRNVYIILAFHAHEPWWDLPAHILKTVDDDEMRASLPSENWVRKRAEQHRDVYTGLIETSKRLGAPMCLEATNELLMQIEECAPETFESIRSGFADGTLYPIYGGAHHAHAALLDVDELADELRLNQEFLHNVLGAPRPRHRGAFPMEGSIDARMQEAFVRAGIEYLIFPNVSPRKAHYVIEGEGAPPYVPFRLTSGIIGLPRHFGVSQDIWRPITKWQPEGLVLQGYILGKYWVFNDEYREKRHVAFPIGRSQAIDEYRGVLERALKEAPDGGLIVYIQDLELMDYGEPALEILEEAWRTVVVPGVRPHIVTPDEYIKRTKAMEISLPLMRFFQFSWAPEIRPVLRCDGQYPPLDAGPVEGLDFDLEGFRRWPFIYWEWGRFHVSIFDSLLRSFGYSRVVALTAKEWWERGYRYEGLNNEERLALHSRSMKQADNWGWQPDEDRQKRPYLHGHRIAHALLKELGDDDAARKLTETFEPLPTLSLRGLARLPELFIDERVAYLRRGIERLGETGEQIGWAHKHLARAEQLRRDADLAIKRAFAANERLTKSGAPYPLDPLRALLRALGDHCRAIFLATDSIQRAWGPIEDKRGMVIEMYEYLYERYPPLFYRMLPELCTAEELSMRENPPLV